MAMDDLMEIVNENPFTFILTIIGLVIGFLLPSGLDYIKNIDYMNFIKNPENVIFGSFFSIIIEIISGFIGALIGCLIGLLIDSSKNNPFS